MRKLLAALLFAFPSLAVAQVTTWQLWPVSWIRWDSGQVFTLGYTTIQNDAVSVTQRSILNVIGGGCVDNAATVSTDCTFAGGAGGAPTDATYITQTANGSLSAEQALSSLSSGIMRVATTTGVITALTDSAGIRANISDETGSSALVFSDSPTLLTPDIGFLNASAGYFNLLEDNDNGSNYLRIIGTDSLSANHIYRVPDMGEDGVVAISGASYPGVPRNVRTTFALWDEFTSRSAAAGVGVVGSTGSGFAVAGAGAASGILSTTFAADGSAPGVITLSTGTTTTGSASLAMYPVSQGTMDSFIIAGGEIVEFRFNVPNLPNAVATDDFSVRLGFCDSPTTNACDDNISIFADENNTLFYMCALEGGNAGSPTASNLALTTGWHIARIQVNSDATSVAYYIDGTELSCSPRTGGNIPSGITEGTTPMVKIVASGTASGCDAAADCIINVDYAYVYKPGLVR